MGDGCSTRCQIEVRVSIAVSMNLGVVSKCGTAALVPFHAKLEDNVIRIWPAGGV